MSFSDTLKQKKIQEWKGSREYQLLCYSLDAEINEILQHGLKYLLTSTKETVVQTRFGSKSNLHRGFYCPSPVYDVCVGNAKRGKLLKHITSRSSDYFIYGFDCDGYLVYAERFWNGQSVPEHIYHSNTHIYGITLNQYGRMSQVSQETLRDGKLISYSKVLFAFSNGTYYPMSLSKEQYVYDLEGLLQSIFTEYVPATKLCQRSLYHFRRRNGKLASYTMSYIIGKDLYELLTDSQEHTISVDRNA